MNALQLTLSRLLRRNPAERFLRWWVGELRDLMPGGSAAKGGSFETEILVEAGADTLAFRAVRGGRTSDLGLLATRGTNASDRQDLVEDMRAILDHGTVVRLVVAREAVLCRRMLLPAAARNSLRDVLAYEMDRQTPFTADQVYYDFRVIEEDPATNEICVEFVAVPRTALDEWLEVVASLGMHVDVVGVDGFEAGARDEPVFRVDLLPAERRRRQRRRVRRLDAVAGVAVSVLAAVALIVPVAKLKYLEHRLAQEVAMTKAAAAGLLEQREHVYGLLQRTEALVQRKRSSPVAIEILAELSATLPDGTWLSGLNLREGELRIHGYSSAASELIGLLENSPKFRDVAFASPVTQDPRVGGERFEIRARIEVSG